LWSLLATLLPPLLLLVVLVPLLVQQVLLLQLLHVQDRAAGHATAALC
jgi:hypothetical protein